MKVNRLLWPAQRHSARARTDLSICTRKTTCQVQNGRPLHHVDVWSRSTSSLVDTLRNPRLLFRSAYLLVSASSIRWNILDDESNAKQRTTTSGWETHARETEPGEHQVRCIDKDPRTSAIDFHMQFHRNSNQLSRIGRLMPVDMRINKTI